MTIPHFCTKESCAWCAPHEAAKTWPVGAHTSAGQQEWGWDSRDDRIEEEEQFDWVDWCCLVACSLSIAWLAMSIAWAVAQRRIP